MELYDTYKKLINENVIKEDLSDNKKAIDAAIKKAISTVKKEAERVLKYAIQQKQLENYKIRILPFNDGFISSITLWEAKKIFNDMSNLNFSLYTKERGRMLAIGGDLVFSDYGVAEKMFTEIKDSSEIKKAITNWTKNNLLHIKYFKKNLETKLYKEHQQLKEKISTYGKSWFNKNKKDILVDNFAELAKYIKTVKLDYFDDEEGAYGVSGIMNVPKNKFEGYSSDDIKELGRNYDYNGPGKPFSDAVVSLKKETNNEWILYFSLRGGYDI